jgi:Flp pilus assembly secretin CpaC
MRGVVRGVAVAGFCLLSASAAYGQAPAWTSDMAASFRSPFTDAKTRLAVNAIGVETMLRLGYAPITDAGRKRLSTLPGVESLSALEKVMPDRSVRVLEVGVSAAPAGGQNIQIFGATIGGAMPTSNPDFADLQQRLKATLAEVPLPTAPVKVSDIRQYIYQTSYVQADRAIAVLKALGMSTIEFSKAAGEGSYESAYEPIRKGEAQLPVVVKLIDAAKTSLMDPAPPNPALMQGQPPPMQQGRQPIPDIGGTFLHQITAGEPQQRLLFLYDKNEPESFERMLKVLTEQIDVPARQVVISALVVEVNRDRLSELGVSFNESNGRWQAGFSPDSLSGAAQPIAIGFNESGITSPLRLTASLKALVDRGQADILSNPSVLVLDGRQARIQIGQQVPVVSSTSTPSGITSSVEYFPVGIVLNLRPRINADGSDVTMQVETIVSAVASNSQVGGGVFFAPTVDNRQVQTFVRVADNTPFIIGGLIANDERSSRVGVPLLSEIPLIGALFRKTTTSRAKREVIVVLTPHVVPLDDKAFSFVLPKDNDIFDSFGNRLFRNAYRLRSPDLYDLRFVYESDVLQTLLTRVRAETARQPALAVTEPFAGLLRGEVPGEAVLVHRMMWEIVNRSGYTRRLADDRLLTFDARSDEPSTADMVESFDAKLAKLRSGGKNAMVISFDAETRGTPDRPLVQPKATITYENITKENYDQRLIELNARGADGRPLKHAIILSDQHSGRIDPLEMLKGVIILKRTLALNTDLPMTIKDFRVGRQIVFPTEEDIQQGFHVIDRDAAQYFFEVMQYYRAFEQEFNRQTQSIMGRLGIR